MMTLRLRLQRMKNQGNIRITFSLEKHKDPNTVEIFRATIEGKFAPLLSLENQDTKIDALINSFNSAVTENPTIYLANTDQPESPGSQITTKTVRQTKRTETKEEYD